MSDKIPPLCDQPKWNHIRHRCCCVFDYDSDKNEPLAECYYHERIRARLAEAERDAARIEWLASNPRGGQIVVDGKTQDCVFWGISGHPRATLRDAIDAARATNSATPRENSANG